MESCIKDISQVSFDVICCLQLFSWFHSICRYVMLCYDQDVVKIQLDECCQGLSRLIQDQLFLTSMVHALEEEKSFTIKDKSVWHSVFYVTA